MTKEELMKKTVVQLKEVAKKIKVSVPASAKKEEIVAIIAKVLKTQASKSIKKIVKKTKLEKVAVKKPLVILKGIKKNYGKTKVLKGIDLTIYEGEKVAILGANGAGKSTLTEIISGLKEPSKGEINYSFGNTKKDISANIGIQFQKSSYPMFYKVIDIVKFFVEAAGMRLTNEEIDKKLKEFQLLEVKKQDAMGLSGGQQQRLNILLGLIHRPKLMLLDELSTGLDVESRTNMKDFVKKQLEELKGTMILVSHNPDEIEYLADRIVTINGGQIFEDITMSEILKKYSSFEEYVTDLFINRFKQEGVFK